MKTFRLGGKDRTVKTPVFRQLRRIIPLYQALGSSTSDADSLALITELLSVFFERDATRLGRLSEAELAAFLGAIPELAGLTPCKPGEGQDAMDWGGLYAHLAACFGWSYEDIDERMTMPRYLELIPYLKNHPPTHQLVAAFVGYERKEADPVRHFFKSLLAKAGR